MKQNILASIFALAVLTLVVAPCVHAQNPPPAPPVTAGDSKELEAALALVREAKWLDAMQALEKWRDKFGKFSPRVIEAKYNLAIAYLNQEKPMHDLAAGELRGLLKEPDTKVPPASKEQFQILIAKAATLKALEMPADTEVQATTQVRMLEIAIKEYDTFLTTYPNSKSTDSAWYMSGVLALQAKKWDDAARRFRTVVEKFAKSPLYMPSLMNIGKTYLLQANSLLDIKDDKQPEDAVKAAKQQAMIIYETSALPALTSAYQKSGDLALMNEAVFYIGQIQLTRSQNVFLPDEDAVKKRQQELLSASLDAFRAVRSREEVVEAQKAKIADYKKAISLLNPANQAEYVPMKNYYENLIQLEEDKVKKFGEETDQFLSARLAIARVFLFLKKPDESRALIRYLQGQKEVFAAEKNKTAMLEAQADIAGLLALSYIEQKNFEKSGEAAEAFRAAYKGNTTGDNIPLLLANLALEKNKPDKAEELVKQAEEDYKPKWRFSNEANAILVGVALDKGDFDKAASLVDAVLASNPNTETEEQNLYLKGVVLRAMASQKQNGAKADEAIVVFQTVRDKFPNKPKAEDAWFDQISIMVGRDPMKAKPELLKFIEQFEKGGGKSDNTPKNVPVAQFFLAKVYDGLSRLNPPTAKVEDAIASYRAVIEKWPESEPAPTSFFKIFDIHNERKEYNSCVKVMEEFVQKYPKHENVYYSYNNIAEILFSGALRAKVVANSPVQPGAVTIADIEAGAKKLNEFVDYEIALTPEVGKEPPAKRGDGSMIKAADRWQKELAKLPPYITLTNDQKLAFQKCIDGMISSIEKLLGSYPDSPRFAEGLERIVTAQTALLKAQQSDVARGRKFFADLKAKHGKTLLPELKIMLAEAAFLQEPQPAEAKKLREEAFQKAPPPGKIPTFTANDYDLRINDLFGDKKYDDIAPVIARVRGEYPLDDATDPATVGAEIRDAQAVSLFWEAKVLGEQSKAVEAGAIFNKLKERFPKSEKVFEAEYGIVLGAFSAGKGVPPDAEARLAKIVNGVVGGQKSFELPAKALLLMAQIQEKAGENESAVANYLKIHARYASVPKIAAQGLWSGAQLLEKQASGTAKIHTSKELEQLNAQKAQKRKEFEETEKKKTDAAKPAAAKPGDQKPADPKAEKKPADGSKPPEGKEPPKPSTSEGTKPDGKPPEKATAQTEPAKN